MIQFNANSSVRPAPGGGPEIPMYCPEVEGLEASSVVDENFNKDSNMENTVEMVEAAHDAFTTDPDAFVKLLEDAEKPIYPGNLKFTKLSTLVSAGQQHHQTDEGRSFRRDFPDLLLPYRQLPPDGKEQSTTTMTSGNSDEDTLRSDSPPPTDYRAAASFTVNFAQAQTTATRIFSAPATIYDSGDGHVWLDFFYKYEDIVALFKY
ncbi:unnamed protein product [Cuscuta campestris]|uniref:Uncharacterized protein n=1 Tax=Cuscuta campestris TaxID=132261 RepID=A0A484MIM7_9ASTE|nr:unnamed protein product [Cuscuta campestris]